MGAADKGADQGGCRCPYLRPDLLGNGPVFHYIWVVDVGHDPPHWENVGQIPPQDGLQADREETLASKGWCMVIPPNGVRNRRGGTAGGGYRCLPPSEHSCTVYCDRAHYVPVSGGGAEAGSRVTKRL